MFLCSHHNSVEDVWKDIAARVDSFLLYVCILTYIKSLDSAYLSLALTIC